MRMANVGGGQAPTAAGGVGMGAGHPLNVSMFELL